MPVMEELSENYMAFFMMPDLQRKLLMRKGMAAAAGGGRALSVVRRIASVFGKGAGAFLASACLMLGSLPVPAAAAPRTIQIIEQSNLRFGKIAVPYSGERVVGTDGSVRDTGILSAGAADTGPAKFVVTYDRGNEGKRVITVEVQLGISSGLYSNGGVEARLKNLTSDIPGYAMIADGQIVTLSLPNCQTRVCRTEFTIGATLQVTNTGGGAEVVIPTYLDVTVVSID